MGGGVLLYISENLAAVPCKALNDVSFDNSLWPLSTNDKLLVGVLYRAPSSSNDNNQRLLSIISNIREAVSFSHLLIMGDFNLPTIDWTDPVCSGTVQKNCYTQVYVACISQLYTWYTLVCMNMKYMICISSVLQID